MMLRGILKNTKLHSWSSLAHTFQTRYDCSCFVLLLLMLLLGKRSDISHPNWPRFELRSDAYHTLLDSLMNTTICL